MTQDIKPSLNFIRYHYFLDSSLGINSKRFMAAMSSTSRSLLDWFQGIPKSERDSRNKHYLEDLVDTNKTEEELEKVFRERKERYLKFGVPKPVPGHLTREEAKERIANFEEFPREGMPFEQILLELDKETNPSIRFNEHHLGEQHPFGLMPAIVGAYLGVALNENVIAQKVSPSTTLLEHKTSGWLSDLVGRTGHVSYTTKSKLNANELQDLIPKGNIVGGGTVANLTALLVARNKALYHEFSPEGQKQDEEVKKSIGVAELGFREFSNPKEGDDSYWLLNDKKKEDLIVITSDQVHYSIEKLVGYIGLGSKNCWKVKTTPDNKIDIDSLKEKIEQAEKENKRIISIVANAGTTGTGAIDPLDDIADIIDQHYESTGKRIFFHVDAAHGAGFLAAPSFRGKFKGIERADSVTMDGHKMFYTHYSCGGIIFKDKTDPSNFLKQSADYILDDQDQHYNSGKQTVEGSRGTGGILQLYSAIKSLGEEGYDVVLNHIADMTKYLAELADRSEDIEKLHDPELNMLSIRYVPKGLDPVDDLETINQINKRINELVYEDGEFYIGNNNLRREGGNIDVQRVIVVNPYVERETMDALVKKIQDKGAIAQKEVLAR